MLGADQALRKVESLYRTLLTRRAEASEYDDFYEGKQPLKFASREWAEFHKDRYTGFADNWCGVVPDALNERLRILSIRAGKSRVAEEEMIYRVWQENDLAAQSSQGFLQTAISKRSNVLVWPGKDGTEVTWEHPSTSIVEHDAANSRRRRHGLKTWVDDKTEYAVLYDPDAAWKFRRTVSDVKVTNGVTAGGIHVTGTSVRQVDSGSDWEPWQPRDDDTWPISNPLGRVPLVEIPNRPRLGRGPISDIHGTIAMQNAINLLWAYLFGAADHASFPARVVMGQEPPKLPILNAEGEKIGEKAVDIKELQHGRLLWLTGQETSISQWDAAKLDVFTDVIEIAVGHISSQSRVPAHYFVANSGLSNINGETLTATETPLVKKVEEFQLFTSGQIAEVAQLIAIDQNNAAFAESLGPASVKWANPSIRSDAQLADMLTKKRALGYPFEWIMELDEVSPEDQPRILEMIRREQSDPDLAALVDRMNYADPTGG